MRGYHIFEGSNRNASKKHKKTVRSIGVLPQKYLGSNTVLPTFYIVFPNHDLLAFYGYENKFCLKFKVMTEKRSSLSICL